MKKVVIINYEIGNLNSVKNALDFLSCETVISDKGEMDMIVESIKRGGKVND